MRLSVLIPVYNECRTIMAAVRKVRALPLDTQIICVDDASTDGTLTVLKELRARGEIDELIAHDRNRGKGAAVRSALTKATGNFTVIQDADLEYDPQDLLTLIVPLSDGRADAVLGSRFRGNTVRVLYYWHSVGNHFLTTVSNMLTNLNVSDMETCYKMLRTDLFKSLPLQSERFGIEPELMARLAQAGARIYEVPISYSGRTYAEGKKIGWRDGVAAFWHIVRNNLAPPFAPRYEPAFVRSESETASMPDPAATGLRALSPSD